jgi:hypothetical protein
MYKKTNALTRHGATASKLDVFGNKPLAGGEIGRKKGGPRNEGISTDVTENKGRKNWPFGLLQMLLKRNELYVFLQMLLKTRRLPKILRHS